MKPTDIKWAFTHELETGIIPTELLRKCILLFTGEIIRSDELSIIAYRGFPVALCRLYRIDFETRDTYVEEIEAPGFDWQFLFDLLRAKQGLIVSGFDILCYRKKNLLKAVAPQKNFTSYSDAKKYTSRILTAMFSLHTSAELNLCSVAQVSEKASDKYFEGIRKGSHEKYVRMNKEHFQMFQQAVDVWQEKYTDDIGLAMYKRTKRFPLTLFPKTQGTQAIRL
ncbi:MAG: hypothetical protein AAFR58_10745 [Cyanobacteria bacterium J06627_28]